MSFNINSSMSISMKPPSIVNPLLCENFAWVDERLRELYYGYGITAENVDEYLEAGLLKEQFNWVDEELENLCKHESQRQYTWVTYEDSDEDSEEDSNKYVSQEYKDTDTNEDIEDKYFVNVLSDEE